MDLTPFFSIFSSIFKYLLENFQILTFEKSELSRSGKMSAFIRRYLAMQDSLKRAKKSDFPNFIDTLIDKIKMIKLRQI